MATQKETGTSRARFPLNGHHGTYQSVVDRLQLYDNLPEQDRWGVLKKTVIGFSKAIRKEQFYAATVLDDSKPGMGPHAVNFLYNPVSKTVHIEVPREPVDELRDQLQDLPFNPSFKEEWLQQAHFKTSGRFGTVLHALDVIMLSFMKANDYQKANPPTTHRPYHVLKTIEIGLAEEDYMQKVIQTAGHRARRLREHDVPLNIHPNQANVMFYNSQLKKANSLDILIGYHKLLQNDESLKKLWMKHVLMLIWNSEKNTKQRIVGQMASEEKYGIDVFILPKIDVERTFSLFQAIRLTRWADIPGWEEITEGDAAQPVTRRALRYDISSVTSANESSVPDQTKIVPLTPINDVTAKGAMILPQRRISSDKASA